MKDDAEHTDAHSREYPIREDMAYQRKVWRFERYGWYGLVLLILLALAGLFSGGILSAKNVRSQDGEVRVEYEMFHRNGASEPMKITVKGAADSTVEVALEGELLEGFTVETLLPEAVRARGDSQGIRLWVRTDSQGQASLYLPLRSNGVGLFRSRIATASSRGVALDQFIFP
jgi:hypothetical protein